MSGPCGCGRGRFPTRRAVCAALVAAGWSGATAAGEPEPAGDDPPLRVAAAPVAAVVEWTGARPGGAMVEIWNEISTRLGRRTEFIRSERFTDELTALAAGTADVALGPLAITAERERSLDLTHPVVHSGLRVAVRERQDSGVLAAFRGLPARRLAALLAAVVALAAVSGHLLWWVERRHNAGSFPERYPQGVLEAMWWIASTIVAGGCDNKHVAGWIGRAIAFAWMLGGIVLAATFTSLLTAAMTAERMTGSILGPRDLAGRVVGCPESSVVVPVLRERGAIPREYTRLDDALDALQSGTVDAVVTENLQLASLLGRPERRGLAIVGSVFEVFDYAMGLRPGSPLREEINAALLRMREDGTLERILSRWFGPHE